MAFILSFISKKTTFLYVGIILLLSTFSVYATVGFLEEHEKIESAYASVVEQHFDRLTPQQKQEYEHIFSLSGEVHTYKEWMYWSAFFVGMICLVFIILNSDKLQKLEKNNEDKKKILKLLEYRLAAMEASHEGIGIVDNQGNLTYMNRALMSLHGIEAENQSQFLGVSWLCLYTPAGRKQVQEDVMPKLLREGFWRGISDIVRQDGNTIRAELSLTRLDDGGIIGTARDVTEQENIEREHKVMQNQLFQAQKMEAIGRLSGGIAHDFNNILAAINGYAEFLIEDLSADSAEQKFAINILKAGRQARDLVDQILSFSRRESAERQIIDLRNPIREAFSMLEATLPKTIELHKNIEVSKALVYANSTEIVQVIMNLAVNAKDAMRDDRGILTIGLQRSDGMELKEKYALQNVHSSHGNVLPIHIQDISAEHTRLYLGGVSEEVDYICLTVEDSGTGMSRAVMEHVLEPFFTTKPVDQGTGLGLSIVHGVVTAYNGILVIDSILGRGTCFEIYFPLEKESDVTVFDYKEKSKKQNSGRILLVDDQEEVRDMTSTMLSRLGYSVEAAANGLQALEIIRARPQDFDLVLTDQNMPKMTGLELVYQVHADYPRIPFVFLSGYSLESIEALIQEHPVIYEVLRKPILQKNLEESLGIVFAKINKTSS